jgi:hypothetical protein
MKNKTSILTLLIITTFILASCASSRNSGYRGTRRPGYGCPVNASIQNQFIEKNKI